MISINGQQGTLSTSPWTFADMSGPFGGGARPFGPGGSSSGGPAEALRAAAESGDVEAATAQLALPSMSKQLIDSADSGYFGGTALSFAAEGGHTAIVAALLTAGASTGLADRSGYSPLHLAAQNGHDVICKLLLKRGVKPDRHNGQGFAPLHITSSSAVCFVLLAGGANPYARSRDGKSAMSIAAEKGNEGVYEQLAAKFAGKMRKESIRERKMMKERKEHYLQALAEERQERIKQKKQDQMKSYLKFRWA